MENLGENLYENVFVEISMRKSLCENFWVKISL